MIKNKSRIPSYQTIKIIFINIITTLILVSTYIYHENTSYKPENIIIAGGPEKMTFQPVIKSIHSVLKKNKEKFVKDNVLIKNGTHGSQENLRLLCKGNVDLALIHANANIDSPCGDLRAIANILKSKLHIISTYKNISDITKINDSTKIYIGSKNSGTNYTARTVLDFYAIEEKNRFMNESFYSTLENINNGEKLIAFFLGGVPLDVVESIKNKSNVNFVILPNIEVLADKFKFFSRDKIVSGIYKYEKSYIKVPTPFPPKTIDTLSVNTLLVASEKFSNLGNNIIFNILKELHDNKYDFRNIHNSMIFNKKFAVEEPIIFPLHEGAKEYYDGKKNFFTSFNASPMKEFLSIIPSIIALLTFVATGFLTVRSYKFNKFKNRIISETLEINKALHEELLPQEINEKQKRLIKNIDELVHYAVINNVSLSKIDTANRYIEEAINRCDNKFYKTRDV